MSTPTLSRLADDIESSDEEALSIDQLSNEQSFLSLVRQGITQYRHGMSMAMSITEKDVKEFERYSYETDTWKKAGAKNAEDVIQMMQDNVFNIIPDAIRETCTLEGSFVRDLREAERKGWVDNDSVKWWESQLQSKNKTQYEKTQLLKEKFPKQLENCRQVAEMRDDVEKLAQKHGFTKKEIPELADVLDKKKFLSFTYPDRKNKVHKAKALVLAFEKNQEKFLRFVEKEMKDWASAGWMHKTKIGPWMRRIMESDNPEVFASKVLRPFKNNWKQARERYDDVMPKLLKEPDKMRGFKQVSATKFLLLDYDQRIAYIEEAESRLESDVNEEGPLAALRLDIRHAMDTGDWEEADALLNQAHAMNPDDKAVRSMGRYLESHRDDKGEEKVGENIEKKNKGMEALTNLRDIMSKLHPNMRYLTEKALNSSNPNTLKRLWQLIYNRHWVRVHGYSTNMSEQENAENKSYQQQTEDRIANGHELAFEHNFIKGKTAQNEGIHDDPKKPQVLHTDTSGLSAIYKGVEANADNAQFGYWTTMQDNEIPYEIVREAVLNYMWDIKQNAKILRESGLSYSSTGTPFSNTKSSPLRIAA